MLIRNLSASQSFEEVVPTEVIEITRQNSQCCNFLLGKYFKLGLANQPQKPQKHDSENTTDFEVHFVPLCQQYLCFLSLTTCLYFLIKVVARTQTTLT